MGATAEATTVEQNVVKGDASGMSATASNSGNGDDGDDEQVGLLSALLAAILLLIGVVIGAMFRVESAMAGAARTTDASTKPPSSSPISSRREDSDHSLAFPSVNDVVIHQLPGSVNAEAANGDTDIGEGVSSV